MEIKTLEIKLWLFGRFLSYTAVHNINYFYVLLNCYSNLAEEYFTRRIKRIEKVELPSEFYRPEHTRNMLYNIHQKINQKTKKISFCAVQSDSFKAAKDKKKVHYDKT